MSQLVKCWPGLKCGITLAVYTSHCVATRPPEHTPPTSRILFQPITPEKPIPSRSPAITRALVNPTNEELIGTALPYFPMAGPPPKELLTTGWGGASAGSGMLYAVQSVDGIVNLHGGPALREACRKMPIQETEELIGGGGNRSGGVGWVRCPVGSAVITEAFGHAIMRHYNFIIHSVPPLWPGVGGSNWSEEKAKYLLTSCYYESFKMGFSNGAAIVTAPLMGAGARRVPVSIAIDCAVKGVLDAMDVSCNTQKGHIKSIEDLKTPKPWPPIAAELVVLEPRIADEIVNVIDNLIEAAAAG